MVRPEPCLNLIHVVDVTQVAPADNGPLGQEASGGAHWDPTCASHASLLSSMGSYERRQADSMTAHRPDLQVISEELLHHQEHSDLKTGDKLRLRRLTASRNLFHSQDIRQLVVCFAQRLVSKVRHPPHFGLRHHV